MTHAAMDPVARQKAGLVDGLIRLSVGIEALEDLRATLDRSFKDQMWSQDGMISKDAWATAKAVVREAGILKSDVAYEEIIDMSFVESVRANL